ncbi:hypothetical protein ACOSP6_01840 [Tenacibaculum sp. MEBiC06402]|uniref:hypothetical protein n=1 Tax=unclassified Tenacibaculum TaxID=2635139 RepID=UPI003B9A007B
MFYKFDSKPNYNSNKLISFQDRFSFEVENKGTSFFLIFEISWTSQFENKPGSLSVIVNNSLYKTLHEEEYPDYFVLLIASIAEVTSIQFKLASLNSCVEFTNGVVTSFYVNNQLKSNWCWAAVTRAILRRKNPRVIKSQYEIAKEILKFECLCKKTAYCGKCNRPYFLADVLSHYDVLEQAMPRIVDKTTLEKEISNDKIIVLAVKLNDSALGHLLTISSKFNGFFTVWDSKKVLPELKTYEELLSLKSGVWLNTFITK